MSSKTRKNRNVAIIILCLLGVLVVWLGFGRRALVHLYHTEMDRQTYVERIRRLTAQNQELLKEVERLRTDLKYIEFVARRELSMIKPNEVIYRFKKETPDERAEKGLGSDLQGGKISRKSKDEDRPDVGVR